MAECSVDKPKMVVLKTSDGAVYKVEETVAKMSQVISQWMEDNEPEDAIPLPNVSGQVLGKVLEFCKKRAEEGAVDAGDLEFERKNQKLKNWQAEYVDVEMQTLFEITLAANYLEVKDLMELVCQKIADRIQNMSVEEVRKVFNIENDYTQEEEEEIRNEFPWAFQESAHS